MAGLGCKVHGIGNGLRRQLVQEKGGQSVLPRHRYPEHEGTRIGWRFHAVARAAGLALADMGRKTGEAYEC